MNIYCPRWELRASTHVTTLCGHGNVHVEDAYGHVLGKQIIIVVEVLIFGRSPKIKL